MGAPCTNHGECATTEARPVAAACHCRSPWTGLRCSIRGPDPIPWYSQTDDIIGIVSGFVAIVVAVGVCYQRRKERVSKVRKLVCWIFCDNVCCTHTQNCCHRLGDCCHACWLGLGNCCHACWLGLCEVCARLCCCSNCCCDHSGHSDHWVSLEDHAN